VIVQNVIGQLDGILATPVMRSPFYSPAARSTLAFAAHSRDHRGRAQSGYPTLS
jgi:hypothetical protein